MDLHEMTTFQFDDVSQIITMERKMLGTHHTSMHLKIGRFLLPGKTAVATLISINLKPLKPSYFQLPHKNGTRIPMVFQVLGCFSYVFQVLGWFFLCFPGVFGWVEPPPPPPPTASEAETFFAPPGLCKSNTAVAWSSRCPGSRK